MTQRYIIFSLVMALAIMLLAIMSLPRELRVILVAPVVLGAILAALRLARQSRRGRVSLKDAGPTRENDAA